MDIFFCKLGGFKGCFSTTHAHFLSSCYGLYFIKYSSYLNKQLPVWIHSVTQALKYNRGNITDAIRYNLQIDKTRLMFAFGNSNFT